MQPFKLVPSLSARIPGRITSPRGLDVAAAASQGMGTSRNRPSDGQDLWVTTAVFNSCYDAVTYLSLMVTLLHLWSCAIAMNSTARRYPNISKLHIERTRRMLPWTGCFKGSNSSRASVKLAPKFHSRGSHVPSLTLPPFTCAGVLSQRASSERGTGSGTGNRAPKKPQQNENSEVSKSKKRKEIQGVQNCAAENPKAWHGDARRTRCQMKVILVETRNLASVFPALDAGQEPCGDAVPTNRRKFYQQEYNRNCHISHMYGSPLDLRFF